MVAVRFTTHQNFSEKGFVRLKTIIRNLASRHPRLRHLYEGARHAYHHLRKLAYFGSDARMAYRHMQWQPQGRIRYWALSAELLFQYHKLEKGLCMPGKKRFFGYNPATTTLALLGVWRQRGYPLNDPIYLGAIETLRAYRARINLTPPERGLELFAGLDAELARSPNEQKALSTPRPEMDATPVGANEFFPALMRARRSIRSFSPIPAEPERIEHAIAMAQLSPSGCNRQPARVHCYADRAQIDPLLALQNGNRGFGQTASTLLVLTAEASGFFDASERHAPYIDGGMFAMSLILGLQAVGLSTCCLNWGVSPQDDRRAHKLGNIPESERIVMFILVGYPDVTALVPRSPRRALESVCIHH